MPDFTSLPNDYVPAETRRPVAQRHQEQIVNGARGAPRSGLLHIRANVLLCAGTFRPGLAAVAPGNAVRRRSYRCGSGLSRNTDQRSLIHRHLRADKAALRP